MSFEHIGGVDDVNTGEAGPSTGSWATHKSGDAEGSFPDMDVDADLDRVSIIESLCMMCQQQGVTKLLLTRIPYFRDIVVMSFECPHCFARSAEVQPANELAPKASRTTLSVNPADVAATKADLNRQVIKSETCRVLIPEVEFEIPANDKRGDINTVEGMLSNIADSLEAGQPNRELGEPEIAAKLAVVISSFRDFAAGTRAFTLVLDDPGGNSFLENPAAPGPDPRAVTHFYERTKEQTLELGYAVEENRSEIDSLPVLKGQEAAARLQALKQRTTGQSASSSASALSSGAAAAAGEPRGVAVAPESLARMDTYFNVSDRAATMQGQCPACAEECETRMCVTDVPHFKDVVLLVTQCDQCGYRDAEVKPMGQVSRRGRRITLRVTCVADLRRDLLKSDTASCAIPELELELMPGTLGGKYTTLEGVLGDIKEQLTRCNPFALGDSSAAGQRAAMAAFLARLEGLSRVSEPFTFVLDDPLGNVFIFSPLGADDPNIVTERYERSHDQNEQLGLNDINVDEYMSDEQRAELKIEMDREKAQKEVENAMQAAMIADGSASSATPAAPQKYGDKSDEQRTAEGKAQMIELKKAKIGGNISVEYDVDDDSVSAQPEGSGMASAVAAADRAAAVGAAAASSSSSSSSAAQ